MAGTMSIFDGFSRPDPRAGPWGDVRALGDWLQAGQLNDLCTFQAECGRSPGPLGWFQEIGRARVLGATADPPDSRRIAWVRMAVFRSATPRRRPGGPRAVGLD